MKIEESSVVMSSAHDLSSERTLSYASTTSFRTVYAGVQAAEANAERAATSEKELQAMIEQFAQQLIEFIFGKSGVAPTQVCEVLSQDTTPASKTASVGRGVLSFDWTTRTTETLHEHESLQYNAQGSVQTADGRTLEFDLGLSLCRDFSCTREQLASGTTTLRDPLVLNFGGNACALSGKRFAFDLDVDGQCESIPTLAASSAFLALDRNQDGSINDGSELFGAQSGNGFADLAAFDQDGNGWIDESDAVYQDLRVWRPGADGEGRLSTLQDEGIGAIKLESSAGAFALTDEENQILARIRSSGIYLRETGGAGSIQQVDLSV